MNERLCNSILQFVLNCADAQCAETVQTMMGTEWSAAFEVLNEKENGLSSVSPAVVVLYPIFILLCDFLVLNCYDMQFCNFP